MINVSNSGDAPIIPASVSDRQGFNKRWYASNDQLQIYRPTAGIDVVDAFNTVLRDKTIEPGQCQITCGRHCYEGFVYNPSTKAVIDLTGLKSYGEATVGSIPSIYLDVGLGNWDMYRLLNNVYQKTVPAGACYSVGLGGHITGGGYGVLSRLYGLSIDYLIAIDIVIGDRKNGARMISQCSATNQPELFWAIRGGGGGQFGIITRYYFDLQNLPDSPDYIYIQSLNWNWMLSNSNNPISFETFSSILNYFQDVYTNQSESSWNTFGIFHGNHMDAGSLGFSSVDIYNESLHGIHTNFETELLSRHENRLKEAELLSPLSMDDLVINGHPYIPSTKALGLNPESSSRGYTFLEGMQQLNASGPNRYGKYKSAYHTQKFTDSMMKAAYSGLTQKVIDPNGKSVNMKNSLIQFDAYGGKINTVPSNATAITQRSSIMKLQYQSYWVTSLPPGYDDETLKTAHVSWLNQIYQNIYSDSGGIPNGIGTEGCYYNYPDIYIGSTKAGTPPIQQALSLYFGKNLDRLVNVSATYNPESWFQNSQSISNIA